MKLLNHSLKYLAIVLIPVIGAWAALLYFNLLDEVRDSIDDGLDNHRLSILQSISSDSILPQTSFDLNNYILRELPKPEAEGIRDIYKDTLMFVMNEQDLEPARMLHTAFERNGHYYELKVISSMAEEDDLMEDLFWSLVWLYIILLLTLILINNLLLRKIWKPFYEVLEKLKSYRPGNQELFPSTTSSIKEFNELKKATDELFAHANQTFANQKAFTENASHELQTPLAIGIAKLEQFIENASLSDEEAANIAGIIGVLERMKRLNKSLLLLARIENQQFQINEKFGLRELVLHILDESSDFISFRKLTIDMQDLEENSRDMNADLALILFSNLLKNAIVHNINGGSISVKLGQASFLIENTGETQALDPNNIFIRFHKSETKEESTGLGLSIVKAICDLYGYHIEYRFKEPNVHTLELFFH